MKSLGKIILCGLMVSSVFVNAGEEQEGRDSACARIGAGIGSLLKAPVVILVGIATFYAGSSLYHAFQPQFQAPALSQIQASIPIACMMEEFPAPLHVAAFECDSKVVGGYLRDGYGPLVKGGCIFFEDPNSLAITRLSKVTPIDLARIRANLAKKKGDLGRVERCEDTLAVLDAWTK